ncbi:MAG TPA: bifunctional 3-hydroxydecanoyl-ACP dehydratase/trans-2-decenoyl-ACP isomerase [Gammaproteobacteria bacterium]|nr:bifunctional 3-hydroxydecanoyl-ACP dehydratase/trans-2-decenoyl-ACP isomerase [Gammaproteobacteria bacterium]
MKYSEFLDRQTFSKEDLIAFAYGRLVSDPPQEFSRLPAPPFLMIDRVTEITRNGQRGTIHGEKDIKVDEWFFQCHFNGDPVQPGCLGVDAIWQLLGFYCVCRGSEGNGRALGCKEISFEGQIRPYNKLVKYEIEVKRYSVLQEGKTSLVVGSAKVLVDDELIYTLKDAKVGIFTGIAYKDYPDPSENSIGGILQTTR